MPSLLKGRLAIVRMHLSVAELLESTLANELVWWDDKPIGNSRERLAVSPLRGKPLPWQRQGSQLIEEFTMNTMKLKKIAAGAAVAGALGFASIGMGAGQAQADDWCWWGWCDPVPPPAQFVPSPGQIGQLPFVPPPGHWDKPGKWWR